MWYGKFSNKYSGRHGESKGWRSGKKRTAKEQAVLTHKIRHGNQQEAEEAFAALALLRKAAMKFATGFSKSMRFFSRRAA